MENVYGNFTSDEGDDVFIDLSYCLRFNFRICSANVTINVDDVVTNQIQTLRRPFWRPRRWVEAEHNVSAILSNFQVNLVDSVEIGLPL